MTMTKKALTGLVVWVFVLIMAIWPTLSGSNRVGEMALYLALGVAIYMFGLWLGGRRDHPSTRAR